MAELKYLSVMLDNFNNQYDSLTSISGPKGDISSELTSVANQLNDAISGFSSASSDSKIADLNSGLALAKQGLEVVKSHVDGDLDALLGNGAEVKAIIDEILELRRQGQSWKESGLERVWNNTIGSFVESWHDNDTYKIDQANRTIDQKNEKGEAQLQAMSAAINGVAFGVAGNMKMGGSLGQSVTYPDNYNFDGDKWDQEHPVYDLNFFQEVGCFVLGTVESGVKIVEGVVDAALTPVAGVVSLIKGNDDHALTKFIQTDWANEGASAVAGVIGVNKESYNASSGRSVGSTIGTVVGHGALWCTGWGAVVSAVSIAGNTSETVIQNGGTVGEGLWKGTLMGTASYAGGKVLGAVVNKVSPAVSGWVNNSGNVVAKTLKAASTSFKDWGSLSVGGKVVSTIASPVRGATNLLSKATSSGAKVLDKAFGSSKVASALGAVDAKATNAAQSIVDKVSSKVSLGASTLKRGGDAAVNEYKDAVDKWKAAGSNKTSAEYDAVERAYNKIPEGSRPANIGDQAYTTSQTDALVNKYNSSQSAWEAAGKPTSGAEYDAMRTAYDNIPTSNRPVAVGDTAYTTFATDSLSYNYNQTVASWEAAGKPTSGATYDAMKAAYDNLPGTVKTTTTTIGSPVLMSNSADSLIRTYNDALTTWKISGEQASGAEYEAMMKAYNNIPEAIRNSNVGTVGSVGVPSYGVDTTIRNYNNSMLNWYNAGGNVNSAEYQAMVDAWNSLPAGIRTANPGDVIGKTYQATAITDVNNKVGGLFAAYENIENNG